ncbi:MAG: serine/threonine protein kinase [Myxococcales bacterium]|nr:serine/threonine protein kinase [Myxococcales bacterium]
MRPPERRPVMRCGRKFGPYRLIRRIARGGFGKVLEAIDTRDGSALALKAPLRIDQESLDVFLRELDLVTRLDHRNVMPIVRVEVVQGLPVIAYPLGREALDERVERPMPYELAVDFARQLFAGLAHVHKRGIIHCDIKPENLIVFPDDHLRIADFGLARDGDLGSLETRSGTLEYMAPEHAKGRVSTRSDVFSAGLVACLLLTGLVPRRPFTWPFPGIKVLSQRSPAIVEVLRRATAVDPSERYMHAGVLLRAFNCARRVELRS